MGRGHLHRRVEGVDSEKEQETLKQEGIQTVKNRELLKVLRKQMGGGTNWEDKWEEEEGLVVGELGRKMVADEWLMGEQALVKERRVTGRESTTFVWVSKNSIALELSQIRPFCL